MCTRTRLTLSLLAAGAAALLGTACGDDDGASPDAKVVDGKPADAMPDAAPAKRAGTLAVLDMTVETAGAKQLGVKGGVVSISFVDPDAAGGEVVFGPKDPVLGMCTVTKFTQTNKPRPNLDEGKVTISGPGLLKPPLECSFNATAGGYECKVLTDTADVTIVGGKLTIKGKKYAQNLVGSHIRLTGFKADGDNTTPGNQTYNGTLGIIQQTETTTDTELLLSNTGSPSALEMQTGLQFTILGGFAPIPTVPTGANADFLSDNKDDTTQAAQPVTIKKDASTALIERTAMLQPLGDGIDFSDSPTKVDGFPFTSATANYSCAGAKCGAPTTEPVKVIVLSGITTDVPIPDTAPKFFMPPAEAATTYVTFQCAQLGTSIALSKDAVDKILEAKPTRIETRVFIASGSPEMDGASTINFLVGHGAIGHTSKPPPTPVAP